MKSTLTHLVFFLTTLWLSTANAELEIETIQLQHRTSTEIIPVLQPFIKQGGMLTGTGYKLIIKSTPENIEEVKRLLADIDSSLKQVLITVALAHQLEQLQQAEQSQLQVQAGDVNVSVGSTPQTNPAPGAAVSIDTGKIKYDTRRYQTQQRTAAPSLQQMKVVEGSWATIRSGQSIPIATRSRNPDGTVTETLTYQHVMSGFEVLPRVNKDHVTLMIRPQKASLGAQGGGLVDIQSMETTVSGKLGEWLSLGGSTTLNNTDTSGILHSTRTRESQHDQIWVKVEVIKQ